MTNMKERLSAANGQWLTGKAKRFEEKVPDGTYTCQLQHAELKESNAGKLMIHVEHLVLEGEFANEVVHQYFPLETEYGPAFVAEWIAKMGHEVPEDAAELDDIVATIRDQSPVYVLERKKKGDFYNMKVKRLLEESAAATPAPAAKAKAEAKPAPKATPPQTTASEKKVSWSDSDGVSYRGVIVSDKPDDEGNIVVRDEEGNNWSVLPSEIVHEAPVATGAKKSAPSKKTTKSPQDDGHREALLQFVGANGVEGVTDDMDESAIVAELQTYAWKADTMTAGEVELLEAVGVEVEKPAAKKPTAKKKK